MSRQTRFRVLITLACLVLIVSVLYGIQLIAGTQTTVSRHLSDSSTLAPVGEALNNFALAIACAVFLVGMVISASLFLSARSLLSRRERLEDSKDGRTN
jgi:hypothetical protein